MNKYTLLVGTGQKLLELDQDGNQHIIEHGKGTYCGITWDDQYIYLLSRGYSRVGTSAQESIRIFNSNWKSVGKIGKPGTFSSAHDIIYQNGLIHVANTGKNCIDTFNPTGTKHWRAVWPGHDRMNHLNTVWVDEDWLYVVEHRRGASRISRMKWSEPKKVGVPFLTFGQHNHNFYIEGEYAYFCSSAQGLFIQYHLGDQQVVRTKEFQAYPRGIARGDGCWFVGLSFRAAQGDRVTGPSQVVVLNDHLHEIKRHDLANTGQLGVIRLMGKDRSHNSLDFPGRPGGVIRNNLGYDPHSYWSKRVDPNSARGYQPEYLDVDVGYIQEHTKDCEKILDFGPGVGRCFGAYNKNQEIKGVDLTSNYHDKAYASAKSLGLNFELVVCPDTTKVPWPDKYFDSAVICEVLLHQPTLDAVTNILKELLRVCHKVVIINSMVGKNTSKHCFAYNLAELAKDNGWKHKHRKEEQGKEFIVIHEGISTLR
jgi:uncharacterized protein YuzB (UPF0349 family)